MAQITTKILTVASGNFALAAAATGDTAEVGDNVVLWVKNGDSSSHDVTMVVPGNLPIGVAYPDKTYTIPAGEMWPIPVLPLYADPADGLAHITYSALTSMTRAVAKY